MECDDGSNCNRLKPINYVDSMETDHSRNRPRTLFSLLLDKRKQSMRNRRKQRFINNDNNNDVCKSPQSKLDKEELRVVKDLKEISDSKWCARGTVVTIHLGLRLHDFQCTISPTEGYYRGGTFSFSIHIDKNYPFTPPKIKACHPIFHPNIHLHSLEIGLSILSKQSWKAVLSLNDVLFALQLLFIQPNIDQIECSDIEDEDGDDDMMMQNIKICTGSSNSSNSSKNKPNHSFGSVNHKPSYIPTFKYLEKSSNENIIQNMCAALMFRDDIDKFSEICQRLIRGNINLFGINWQCIERKKMKYFATQSKETYDPSLCGSQSFRLKNTDTLMTKKCSVLRKRRRNEIDDDEVFNMAALSCYATSNGSVQYDSSESQASLIDGVDSIGIEPPHKKRKINEASAKSFDVDIGRNNVLANGQRSLSENDIDFDMI